jgi:hypothetical protein
MKAIRHTHGYLNGMVEVLVPTRIGTVKNMAGRSECRDSSRPYKVENLAGEVIGWTRTAKQGTSMLRLAWERAQQTPPVPPFTE